MALNTSSDNDRRKRVESRHFWSALISALTVAGFFIAAYQLYQAASFQRETVEIDRRNNMAALALESHEAAMDFLAELLASPPLEKLLSGEATPTPANVEQEADISLVTNEVRTAYLKLDGAVSRAMLVEDKEMIACLRAMSEFSGTILESTIPMKRAIDSENIVVALGEVPLVVKRYLSGEPAPAKFASMDDEAISGDDCGDFAELNQQL